MPNCAPLWFLTCLFVSYIFFWILIKQNINWQIVGSVLYIFILMIVCNVEKTLQITQLPWHIDVALIASVFMVIGYHLKVNSFAWVFENRWCILLSVLVGSIIGLYNGRINMVQNQYQNIILFITSAVLISSGVIFGIKKLFSTKADSSIGNVVAFWGENSYYFLGFNYWVNSFLRKCCEIFLISNAVYNVMDVVTVMLGCSVLAFLMNKCKQKIDINR